MAFASNAKLPGKVWEGMRVHLPACVSFLTLDETDSSKEHRMPPTYVLAKDHLQRAATILQGADQRSAQLRHIIERTIGLMDEFRPETPARPDNVLDFATFRHRQAKH